MLNISVFIVEYIHSGKFKYNAYYEYLWRIQPTDFVVFISIGTVMVIIGCILLMSRKKNAIFISLIGAIIKISGYLICGIFLKQNGSWGNNYGPVYLNMDDFIPYLISDLIPGLILFLFIFLPKGKNVEIKK
jgi:hypothetical protein